MNAFYPEIEPFQTDMLDVGEGHQLYIEQCGNREGQPVVFIHGGPGGGCGETDRRFFDPEQYRIILFDQRGCGRSKPHGSLEHNDTRYLVADIEKIRHFLDIEKWHVFGGSWGSTLSLVYAQTHPQQVKSLVLRGIFLGRDQDTMWTFTDGGGAARLFPEYWEAYISALPEGASQTSVKLAYEIMIGDDREAALKLAKAWSRWEISCCTLVPDQAFFDEHTDDESCWTLARHEAHFMAHDCFLEENEILNNCDKIADIPTVIVHGRYDIVCPFDQAWELHKKLPKSQLVVAERSGHASIEPDTMHHLIEATKKMLTL